LISLVSKKSQNRAKNLLTTNTHQTKTSYQKFALAYTNPKQLKANAKKKGDGFRLTKPQIALQKSEIRRYLYRI
jgi:hypothetical protein